MTQAEKLQALVQRAMESGLDWLGWDEFEYLLQKTSDTYTVVAGKRTFDISGRDIIFNHDFASALFGEDPYYGIFEVKFKDHRTNDIAGYTGAIPAFQHHLQQAATAEDPIDYYYSEVFGNESDK